MSDEAPTKAQSADSSKQSSSPTVSQADLPLSEAKRITSALAELHVATLMLAGPALFARVIPLEPTGLVGWRSVIASVVLLIVGLLTGQRLRLKQLRSYLWLAGIGALLAIHWATYFHSLQISNVAVAVLALFTFPVITFLIEPLLSDESWHASHGLLTIGAVVGVGIIISVPDADESLIMGIVWGVVSAVAFSLRNILSRKLAATESSFASAYFQYVFAALCLFPFALSITSEALPHSGMLLVLGIGFTAIPHTLVVRSLGAFSATKVALIGCLQPLYATVAAAVILGEVPSPRTLAGGATVILVAGFASYVAAKPKRVRINPKVPN